MAYDMSPAYLEWNKETVADIHEVWIGKTTELTFRSANHREIRAVRYKVNNLLASLEFNLPDSYKGVREQLRTWTTRDGDYWILHIGRPTDTIPGSVGLRTKLERSTHSKPTAAPPAERMYNKVVKPQPSDWQDFQIWVASQTDDQYAQTLKAEMGFVITSLSAFDGFKEVGWEVSLSGPTTLVLTRRKEENGN